MRRANGTGSCYKLKGKRRKPWIVQVSEVDDDENQIRKTLGYFTTKTEGEEYLSALKLGLIQPRNNITLEEVYNEWRKTKEGKVSSIAMSGYKTAFMHMKKYHKEIFPDLRTAHLQESIDKLHKAKMSKASMHNVKNMLTLIYKYAMMNDIVQKNYAQFIQLPKTSKKEKKRFSDIEIQKLEKLSADNEIAQIMLVLIYTGFRISELMELTAFNIDLGKMIITGGGKTDAGTDRIVPVHNKILPIIKQWIKREGYIAAIDNYPTFRNQWNEFRKSNGFDEDLTIHCTRHTFASLLASKGIDTIYIQKMMGHSNYNMTANVYTHLDTSKLLTEINKI